MHVLYYPSINSERQPVGHLICTVLDLRHGHSETRTSSAGLHKESIGSTYC